MFGRLERKYKAFPGQVVDPVEQFCKRYFDSIVFQPDIIRFLASKVGCDRILLGSDYPFPIGDSNPRKVIEDSDFSKAKIDLMLTKNARHIFGL